jgi:hypothetical protein
MRRSKTPGDTWKARKKRHKEMKAEHKKKRLQKQKNKEMMVKDG